MVDCECHSSNEDEDMTDGVVIERRWKGLDELSAEYDHLGTTPPRTRIRNKERNKFNFGGDVSASSSPRQPKVIRRNTTDNIVKEMQATQESSDNKRAKRRSLKALRGQERDLKLEIDKCRDLPTEQTCISKNMGLYCITKLVESNNRFKSLHSQPVANPLRDAKKLTENAMEEQSESSNFDHRTNFHNTFSMLIKMGNVDKNCKRTMSMEEQTWQNEWKDLIWLEVSARQAGRTATQQDAYLLSRRDTVPSLLQRILEYKYVNNGAKCRNTEIWTTQSSVISSDSGISSNFEENCSVSANGNENECFNSKGCLCLDCQTCLQNVGNAMREIQVLLESLAEAEALYPSTKTMAAQHPLILSDEFINKTKAMCLWFNMVNHQRLKILIIKKLLYKHRWKLSTSKSECSVANNGECITKPSKQRVKFNVVENNTNNSGSVDSACAKEEEETDDDRDVQQSPTVHIKITESQSCDAVFEMDSVETSDVESKVQTEKDLLNVNPSKIKSDVANGHQVEVGTPDSENSRSPYESADSSAGSVNSNESGLASSVEGGNEESIAWFLSHDFNVYNMGPLGSLTKLRLYNSKYVSPYRDYIEKMLKIRGLKRALYFLEKLHLGVLKKARMTLEKYQNEQQGEEINKDEESEFFQSFTNADSSDDDFEYEKHTRCEIDIQELRKERIELRRYGAWSSETIKMELPSYKSQFLFLSTVPMEIIHEFLLMRLETKPEKPSALSIKQLIHELREGLTIAVRLRCRFTRHVDTALILEDSDSKHRKFYESVLSVFDNTLNEVYKLYLSYLSDWANMEHLPRAVLMAEWTFNRNLAQNLKLAATISPLTFSCLTVRQLEGGAKRLKSRVNELRQKAELVVKIDNPEQSVKMSILRVCRDLQCLLSEEKERTLSTAQFARMVSMHLHHNDVFREYREKIYKAMACMQTVLCWTLDQLQDATSSERLQELDECDRFSVQSRTKEIVSQGYKFGFEFHKELCRLISDNVSPENSYNSCTRNSISVYRKSKLMRADSVCYENVQMSMDENYYSFNPFTPISNQEFAYPASNAKVTGRNQSKDEEALTYSLCGKRNSSDRRSSLANQKGQKFTQDLIELTLDDIKTGVPGCESCSRIPNYDDNDTNTCSVKMFSKTVSPLCDWEVLVSRSLVKFAKQWMNFAVQRCERGRGLRPRWANNGLEFLMLTCDPIHTKHLSEAEFEELKTMMDSCISHVIGSSRTVNNGSVSTPVSTTILQSQRSRVSPIYSQNPFGSKINHMSPPTPPTDGLPNIHLSPDEIGQMRRKKQINALTELDNNREETLRNAGVIGHVRQGVGSRDHFKPRPVTFKWQRGIKIGQGRFGKVYTVVNTESGQVLAMKEVSLGIGDRRAVEKAANELQVLEGVVHPHLVRYYGVEIHREEMLIFMELCVEGSLESMIAGCSDNMDEVSGNGLPEQLIRRYTGQLVSAVRALHDRSIAHRDIKSGNIFLTDGGNCLKLGDFGCAVRIRANTTVPGELQGYVGTQAYMAPEVFMKTSGHGRSADIWSLGCVVVEMASGKRPWSEYDSNYQIMFVVGMGNRPEIPSTLSEEGHDFCISCLQHDPIVRASAEKLSHHNFLKVNRNEYY